MKIYLVDIDRYHRTTLLAEIPQLGQLVQQLLQVRVGDFVLQARDQGFGFLSVVAAQAACEIISQRHLSEESSRKKNANPAATAQTSPTRYAS